MEQEFFKDTRGKGPADEKRDRSRDEEFDEEEIGEEIYFSREEFIRERET